MDALVILVTLGATAGAWYWLARVLGRKGRGWFIRHLAGSFAGCFAFVLVSMIAVGTGLISAEPKEGLAVTGADNVSTADAETLTPMKFATVTEMIDDKADFSEENGTFKVISTEPLHIQLATQVVANDLDEVKLAEVRRVALYGVYRTLIHTDAPSVHVSALPMEVTLNPYSARYIDGQKVEIAVTRDEALRAVAGLIEVETLEDLVTPNATHGIQMDSWSKAFEPFYFKPEGQQALVSALQSQ
ncbi:hypothetical protein RTH74_11600 [Pseudomonas sp. zfem001]|uniref:hypothetical protein n=1 Tax=Pseudomonas sp. zfem001 TaxID=3078196 RepID=UPI002927C4ED|nr:hypothetical protein [Pseudomonas sp. zfem001]MDU9408243.1 hypothetical protein [Pseudomonas sp. zfem001]